MFCTPGELDEEVQQLLEVIRAHVAAPQRVKIDALEVKNAAPLEVRNAALEAEIAGHAMLTAYRALRAVRQAAAREKAELRAIA